VPSPPQRSDVDPKGYYTVLGLTPAATSDDVRAAFRRLVKDFHPDTNPAGDANAPWFQAITEAYQVIGNPEKRLAYDLSILAQSRSVVPIPDQQSSPIRSRNVTTAGIAIAASPRENVRGPETSVWQRLVIWSAAAFAFGLVVAVLIHASFWQPQVDTKKTNDSTTAAQETRRETGSQKTKLCIGAVKGPVEIFSTTPTTQLARYVGGLRAGTHFFNFGIDGMEAAQQLSFSRRFATAYTEVLELARAIIAKKGTETIHETIALFEAILAEEQTIDQMIVQRRRQINAIIYLRALQDGYCAFPNAYATDVPTAGSVLAELAVTFPAVSIDQSDPFFAKLYEEQLDRERDEGRQPGGYSFAKTVASMRREIVSSAP